MFLKNYFTKEVEIIGRRKYFPVEADMKRIQEVSTVLLEMLYDPRSIIHDAKLPHELVDLSRLDLYERSCFWFRQCAFMRGKNDSNRSTIQLAKVHENCPEIFDPRSGKSHDFDLVLTALGEFNVGSGLEDAADWWVRNSQLLNREWRGDPRNIFMNTRAYDPKEYWLVVATRIQIFLGFQWKMASMLTYNLMYDGLIPRFPFPPTIDSRSEPFCINTGIMPVENVINGSWGARKQYAIAIRRGMLEYCIDQKVNSVDLNSAMWLMGGHMCANSPQRGIQVVRRGDSYVFGSSTIDFSNPDKLKSYRETCGQCPFDPGCHYFARSHKDSIAVSKRIRPKITEV